MAFFRTFPTTNTPSAAILIRLMVGSVFVSEGAQTFVRSEGVGIGRFESISFPNPEPRLYRLRDHLRHTDPAGPADRLAVIPTITMMVV